VLTKILAAKITNEMNKLQEGFQKMTTLYGEQIEKSSSLLQIFRTQNSIEVFVLKLDTLKVLSVLEQNLVSFPYDMIPETTENNGFSKRALLPFVGELSKSIFGIATENDVRVFIFVNTSFSFIPSIKLSIRSST
jgi:hypothetical protein